MWSGPWGSGKLRLPEFLDSRQMKVAKLSALGNGRLYPPRPDVSTLTGISVLHTVHDKIAGKVVTRHKSNTKGKVAGILKLENRWMLAVIFTPRPLCHREQILRCPPEADRNIGKFYLTFAPARIRTKIPWASRL